MLDDATLLRDYSENRSGQAFAELVRRHTNLVYSAALRRTGGDVHRAQDVVQHVFNELARKPGPVARHPVLAGWLHTATRNAAINAARAERRRHHYEQQAALAMNENSDQNKAAWDRLRPMLDEVIDGLGGDDRDAVLLRYFEERPFAEIGRVLRVSEDAARMRVQRALEKLRESLQKRGFESTTAALGTVLSATQTVVAAPGLATTVAKVALAGVGAATKAGFFGAVGAGLTGTKIVVITGGIAVLIAAVTCVSWQKDTVTEKRPDTAVVVADQATMARPEEANVSPLIAPERGSSRIPTQNPIATANFVAPRAVEPVVRPAEGGNRWRINQEYYALLSNLDLSDEKREVLITLLVDLRETSADYAAAGAGAGVDVTADPDSFNRSVRALRELLHGRIGELLGPDGFRAYQAFEAELKLKSYAVVLERKLRNTPVPLTTEQADELTRIIQQRTFDPKGDQLIAEASRFLSPGQLEALRQIQALKLDGRKKPKVQNAIREQTGQPASATPAP